MFPILNSPPSSLPVPSLWVVSVHQSQASSIYIEPGLVIRFIYDIIHVSMPFSQSIPPSLSPTESKRLFHTSVSLLCLAYRVIVTRMTSCHAKESCKETRMEVGELLRGYSNS